MTSEPLFNFARIPFGDFESCFLFFETFQRLNFEVNAQNVLWQARKALERLHTRHYDTYTRLVVQNFANTCVQAYCFLQYGVECGRENLKKYLHSLVITPEWYREDYLTCMMNLPPSERLAFIDRPVPGPLVKLKMFCIYYDYMYEKIEIEVQHRRTTRIIREVNDRLEQVSESINRRLTGSSSSSGIGRAI